MLYRVVTNALGEIQYRLYVPEAFRYELMHHYHFTLNPGHKKRVLAPSLEKYFYWPDLPKDCAAFTQACRTCAERDATVPNQVPAGYHPTPELPFDSVYVDCKKPHKESGGFKYILVVVCALTRWTVYIPMEAIDGASVFRALFNHVFCLFGVPRTALVSDNGPEFRNNLMDEMAQYLGYRKVNVLPWHPQANGIAEAAVKRIKLLLDRHTTRYHEWHKILPLAQYALNTEVTAGFKLSPFAALFGREPVGLPELENPALSPPRETGSAFLESLRARVQAIQSHLKEISDQTKEKVRNAAEADRYKAGEQKIECGDIVWLQYRNREHALRLMKAGGQPWKHPYRVEAVSNSGAKLVPFKGSPRVMLWQPLQRLTKSPPKFHDESTLYDVDSTGFSLAPFCETPRPRERLDENPLNGHVKDGAPNPDGTYEIEQILSAQWNKKADDYMMKVKWKGWVKPTFETRWFLLNPDNCSDEDIHEQVREAVRRARRGKGLPDDDEDALPEVLTDDSDNDDEECEEEGAVDGGTDQMMILGAADEEFEQLEFFRRKLHAVRQFM